MNNVEFANYCKSKVGCFYWMGTFGQRGTQALFNEKKKMYPSYYTASDFPAQIKANKQVFDCAGLVKSILILNKYNSKDDLGATGIYSKCTKKGLVSKVSDLKVGTLLFKGTDKQKTHVGVYIGDNKIVEAKGHAYGVVTSTYSSSFKYYAEYYGVTYSADEPKVVEPTNSCGSSHKDMVVNTKYDDLMLRSGPGTNYPIMAKMPRGSTVTYLGHAEGDWYIVKYRTYIGYCHKGYLK